MIMAIKAPSARQQSRQKPPESAAEPAPPKKKKGAVPQRPSMPWLDWLLALLLAYAAGQLYLSSPIYELTDSNYTLLLSETLINEHTLQLDRHFVAPLDRSRYLGLGTPDPTQPNKLFIPYQIEALPKDSPQPSQQHLYYWYPNFPSILAIPAVLWLNSTGLHATAPDGSYNLRGEIAMQLQIAAWLGALGVGLIFLLARAWLPVGWSLLIALAFGLASPIWSSTTRALWTSTWGIPLQLGIYLHLSRVVTGKTALRPTLVATLCAFMYFCRPALAVQVLAITLWIAWKYRDQFIKLALLGLSWGLLFCAWSWLRSGEILPAYYRHSGLNTATFWTGLYGSLASPSRGLLVYSPFLVAALVALTLRWRRWANPPLVVLALTATLAQALLLALYPTWHGGHSYGARLMTDTLPATAVWAAAALAAARTGPAQLALPVRALAWLSTAALLGLGGFIHWRGASTPVVFRWNVWPYDMNLRPNRVLDWRQPQFLAGLIAQPAPDPLPPWPWQKAIHLTDHDEQVRLMNGWVQADGPLLWTVGHSATFCGQLSAQKPWRLTIRARPVVRKQADGRMSSQRLRVLINDHAVGQVTLEAGGVRPLTFDIPASDNVDVIVTLDLPDAFAGAAGPNDQREMALAIESIQADPLL